MFCPHHRIHGQWAFVVRFVDNLEGLDAHGGEVLVQAAGRMGGPSRIGFKV